MGQQQLLLLVLGIVLVGLAVVVGISAFNENQQKSTLDQITMDAVRLSAGAQTWKLRPNATGGGQSDDSFTRFTFADLGIVPSGGTPTDPIYVSGKGQFKLKNFVVSGPIAAIAQQQYGITATGNALAIVGLNQDETQSVMVVVFASNPDKPITILQHPYNVSVFYS